MSEKKHYPTPPSTPNEHDPNRQTNTSQPKLRLEEMVPSGVFDAVTHQANSTDNSDQDPQWQALASQVSNEEQVLERSGTRQPHLTTLTAIQDVLGQSETAEGTTPGFDRRQLSDQPQRNETPSQIRTVSSQEKSRTPISFETSKVFMSEVEKRLDALYEELMGIMPEKLLPYLINDLTIIWATLTNHTFNEQFSNTFYFAIDDFIRSRLTHEGFTLLSKIVNIQEFEDAATQELDQSNKTPPLNAGDITDLLRKLQIHNPELAKTFVQPGLNLIPALHKLFTILAIRHSKFQPTSIASPAPETWSMDSLSLSPLSQLTPEEFRTVEETGVADFIEQQVTAFQKRKDLNKTDEEKSKFAHEALESLSADLNSPEDQLHLISIFFILCKLVGYKPNRIPEMLSKPDQREDYSSRELIAVQEAKRKTLTDSLPSIETPNYFDIISVTPELKSLQSELTSLLPSDFDLIQSLEINQVLSSDREQIIGYTITEALEKSDPATHQELAPKLEEFLYKLMGVDRPQPEAPTPEVIAHSDNPPAVQRKNQSKIHQAVTAAELQAVMDQSQSSEPEVSEPEQTREPLPTGRLEVVTPSQPLRTAQTINTLSILESFTKTPGSCLSMIRTAIHSQDQADWRLIFIRGLSEQSEVSEATSHDQRIFIQALNEIAIHEAQKANVEVTAETLASIAEAKEQLETVVGAHKLQSELLTYLEDFGGEAKFSELERTCVAAAKEALSQYTPTSDNYEKKAEQILLLAIQSIAFELAMSNIPAHSPINEIIEELESDQTRIIELAKKELQSKASLFLSAIRENKFAQATALVLSVIFGAIGINKFFTSSTQKQGRAPISLRATTAPRQAPTSVIAKRSIPHTQRPAQKVKSSIAPTPAQTPKPTPSPTGPTPEQKKKAAWLRFLSGEDAKIQLAFEGQVLLDVAGEGLHQRINEAKNLLVESLGKDANSPEFQKALANYHKVKREIERAWHQKYQLSETRGELPVVKASFDPTNSNAYVDSTKELADINSTARASGQVSGFQGENNYDKDKKVFLEYDGKKAKKGLAGAFLKLRDTFKKLKQRRLFAKLRPAQQPPKPRGASNSAPNQEIKYANAQSSQDQSRIHQHLASSQPTNPNNPNRWFDDDATYAANYWPSVENTADQPTTPWNTNQDVFEQETQRAQETTVAKLIRTGKYESTPEIVEGFGGRKATLERLLLQEVNTPEQALAIRELVASIKITDIESDEFEDGSLTIEIKNKQTLAELDIIINQDTSRVHNPNRA